MGTVKVTNIEPIADNGTLTIGNSGDTIALTSGAKTSGFGKIGQVVSVWDDTQRTVTTSTYIDAISASITPSTTSSKILISVNGQFSCTTDTYGGTRLLRGTTEIGSSTQDAGLSNSSQYFQTVLHRDSDARYEAELVSGSYLDSPSTTSATTYKLQFRVSYGASASIKQNRANESNNNSYFWNTPTVITLMEILD